MNVNYRFPHLQTFAQNTSSENLIYDAFSKYEHNHKLLLMEF